MGNNVVTGQFFLNILYFLALASVIEALFHTYDSQKLLKENR